ncbi:MAG: glycosyltransferase [Acidobacteriota bacterium]
MPTWLMPFLVSFGASMALMPLVRAVARELGTVVEHPDDRGMRPPTALFGGVGVAIAVLACSAMFNGPGSQPAVLACGLLIFLVGLADDTLGLQPTTKLAAQVALASVFLLFQYRLELTHSVTFDSFLTVLWIIGVTNAVNRLDSMDGLCGGVTFSVCAGTMILLSAASPGTRDFVTLRHAAILLGAVAGLLVYNTHPASIFLGDSGGLFLGLNLAVLVLEPGASPEGLPNPAGGRLHLLPVVLLPILAVLLIPVVDSGLHTFWRASVGRLPAAQRERAPHRVLGITPSRREAVLVLWLLGAFVMAVVVWVRLFAASCAAHVVAAASIVTAIVAAVLSGLGVRDEPSIPRSQRRITPFATEAFYKYRAVEVLFDACLVLGAYYLAYRLRYPDPQFLGMFRYFLTSLPLVLAAQVVALFAAGTYRGRDGLFAQADATTFGKAVLLGVVAAHLAVLYVLRSSDYPRSAFLVYAVLLFLLLKGSRESFRLTSRVVGRRVRSGATRAGEEHGVAQTKSNRRVIRVITRLNIGGPAIQAASLSQRLGPFGYDTLLMHGRLSPGEGDMRYLLAPDARAEAVPTMGRAVSPLQDLRGAWQIFRAMCRFRPDIVHTHTAKAGAIGRLAAVAYNETFGRLKAARLVHTYHGHVFEGYFGSASTSVFIAIERWLAGRTDALVAISPRVEEDLQTYRIARPGQVRVIPLGFDLSPFAAIDDEARGRARLALGIPEGMLVVTTVGRLTEIKQHDLFLEMAAFVATHRPDMLFLIAGDGELRERLETLARELKLGERVRFLGWRSDLTTIYGATDVFVLTSRNEGTPVALIEAMASGVVGVSTDVGGVGDVITSAEVGALAAFGSAPALANAVLDLAASPDRRRSMGERARAAVLSRFHMDRLLRDAAGLYDELLASPHEMAGKMPLEPGTGGAVGRARTQTTATRSAGSSSMRPELRREVVEVDRDRPARTNEYWRGRLRTLLRSPATLVFIIFLCRELLSLAVIPPWQNPDEPQHVAAVLTQSSVSSPAAAAGAQRDIIRSMAKHGWWQYYSRSTPNPLPSGFSDKESDSVVKSVEHGGGRLYYLVLGAVLGWIGPVDAEGALLLLRICSAIAGALTVYCCWMAAEACLEPVSALVVTGMLALLPQFLIVSTTAGPDAFVNLCGAFLWWQAARLLGQQQSFSSVAGVWMAAVLSSGLRRIGALHLPMAAIVSLIAVVVAGRRSVIRALSVSAAVLVAMGIPAAVWLLAPDEVDRVEAAVRAAVLPVGAGLDLSLEFLLRFLKALVDSSWLIAGWLRFPAPRPWLNAMNTLVVVACAGVVFGLFRDRARRPILLVATALAAVQVAGIFGSYFLWHIMAQGRYLFPVLGPLSVLLWIGLSTWWPERHWHIVGVGLLTLLALFDLVGWTTVFLGAYA